MRSVFTSLLALALTVLIAAALIVRPPAEMSAQASAGFAVWREQGCAGCHALFDAGGGFAPDLAGVTQRRTIEDIRAALRDPALPPHHAGLTVSEIDELIAFFLWLDAQPIPARPTPTALAFAAVVSTGAPPTAALTPAERGRAEFSRAPGNCASCHSLEPDVVIVGPSLAGIAGRAGERVPEQTAAVYLRNAILYPSDYLVPGYDDLMAKNLGAALTVDQVDDLVAFLLTLE
jgi:nitric oxide reductase subunit C